MSTAKKGTTSATTSLVLEAYAEVIGEARAEFETEKATQLAEWKKELARLKEQDNYDFTKAKRDRDDAFDLEVKGRYAEIEAKEAAVEARETAIGDAEKTIETLTATIEGIPAIAAKAESTGYSKGLSAAQATADSAARILAAENKAEVSVLNNKIETLEATVVSQNATIEQLKAELKDANARVQDIATASVNASGQSKVTVNTADIKR